MQQQMLEEIQIVAPQKTSNNHQPLWPWRSQLSSLVLRLCFAHPANEGSLQMSGTPWMRNKMNAQYMVAAKHMQIQERTISNHGLHCVI